MKIIFFLILSFYAPIVSSNTNPLTPQPTHINTTVKIDLSNDLKNTPTPQILENLHKFCVSCVVPDNLRNSQPLTSTGPSPLSPKADYSIVHPYIIELFKRHDESIDSLKKEIEALENKVDDLELRQKEP